MTVTKLEAVTRTKYKVFLDGAPAFVLYKGELSKYAISEESTLSEADYDRIMEESVIKRAKHFVMHLLEAMDRTEAELRGKLRRSGYPDEASDAAIAYVKSYGYLDDRHYLANYIDSHKNSKSRLQIYAALCEKGIDRETVEQAIEDNYDEVETIKKLIAKKKVDLLEASYDELGKLYAYLQRKGFRSDNIRKAIQLMSS